MKKIYEICNILPYSIRYSTASYCSLHTGHGFASTLYWKLILETLFAFGWLVDFLLLLTDLYQLIPLTKAVFYLGIASMLLFCMLAHRNSTVLS